MSRSWLIAMKYQGQTRTTPMKTNMVPENTPLQNEKHLYTSHQFLGSMLYSYWGVYRTISAPGIANFMTEKNTRCEAFETHQATFVKATPPCHEPWFIVIHPRFLLGQRFNPNRCEVAEEKLLLYPMSCLLCCTCGELVHQIVEFTIESHYCFNKINKNTWKNCLKPW